MNIKEAIFGAQIGTIENIVPATDDVQGSLPIADIRDGIILTRDGGYVGLFEVLPMNFFLQNTAERTRIISALAAWMKIAPSSLQFLCLSQPVDVNQYTCRMENYMQVESDEKCRNCIADNIRQVRSMVHTGAFTTRFFIAYRFEQSMAPSAQTFAEKAAALYQVADTAKGYLARCGLTVAEPQFIDNQMVETVFGMLCKNSSRNIKLPTEFRLMMDDYFGIPQEPDAATHYQEITDQPEPTAPPQKRKFLQRKKNKADHSPEYFSGVTHVMDLVSPASIDFTHKSYIEMDGVYHSYLYIAGYGYRSLVRGGWLASLIGLGDGISLSMTLHRRPREKILPKVASSTRWSRSRIRDVDDTRDDYEQIGNAIYAGQYIKRTMNNNNEDYYDMYTLIEITALDSDVLNERIAEVEHLCASQDILCKRCDYVEEQAFHSFLPVVNVSPEIACKARRNTLLSGAAGAFPFYSMELCEQNGILLGEDLHSHSVCMLDIFNADRYSNSNMILLGMSGAGKTYLLQLIAMRYRQQGKQVFLIAPHKGHEYRAACEAIGGLYVKLAPSSTDCINFLEIRRRSLDVNAELDRTATREDSLLADKISRLHIYFSLLRRELSEVEKSLLDVELMRLYGNFGITRDNESIYDVHGALKSQPTPKDLYNQLSMRDETKPLAAVLRRFVDGSAENLGISTNIDMNNKYIVLDISEIGKELLAFGTLLAADICLDYCKRSRAEQKVIILDEIWSLIGAGSNIQAAEFVLELFKTIRGYSAAAIGASQDLEDFFALENGKFGKALLNNSRIKFALMTEPEEANLIQKHYHLTDEEMHIHSQFTRGQALLCAGRNRLGIQITASPREHELITTDPRDIARIHHRQEINRIRNMKMEEDDHEEYTEEYE